MSGIPPRGTTLDLLSIFSRLDQDMTPIRPGRDRDNIFLPNFLVISFFCSNFAGDFNLQYCVHMKKVVYILLACFLLVGCRVFKRQHQAGAAAELNGQYLYYTTLDSLTMGLESADSARVAEQYIRQWAKEILIEEHAKGSESQEIEDLVSAYRRALYVHAYEEYLVQRRMPKAVSDSAIRAVYETRKDHFLLEESLVKGLLVVVDVNAPNVAKLRQWMLNPEKKNLDEIEKYAYKYASGYELFKDRWMTTSALMANFPMERNAFEAQLRQKNQIETGDSTKLYLLQVTDKCLRGDAMPLDYARPEIEKLLLNDRQIEFLQKEREQLYEEAVVHKKIQFYEK